MVQWDEWFQFRIGLDSRVEFDSGSLLGRQDEISDFKLGTMLKGIVCHQMS